MRGFVALELPDALVVPLTRLMAGLSVGRPVAEENLHLTLAFLGDISELQAADLAETLAVRALPSVDLRLHGLDLFGGRKPGVLFAVAEGEGLDRLHDKVARAVREAGIALPRERFRPHVTIARFHQSMTAKDRERLGEFLALNGTFAVGPEPATSLTLYHSHLRPEGALHEPLAEFLLTR